MLSASQIAYIKCINTNETVISITCDVCKCHQHHVKCYQCQYNSPLYVHFDTSVTHTFYINLYINKPNTHLQLKTLPDGRIMLSDELPDLVMPKKRDSTTHIPFDSSSENDIKPFTSDKSL